MASEVLQKTRKINKTLQTSGGSNVSFDLLAGALGEVLSSNVYVLSSKGKVLGLHLNDIADSSVVEDDITKQKKFPEEYNTNVLKIKDTLENLTGEELLEVFPFEQGRTEKKTTIVPILGSGQRLGTLILSRYDNEYEDDDLVIAEYSATVIGLEILRAIGEELEEEMRKKAVVQMAIGTLSYSELEAVEHIFEELDGKEGLLVASKIADRVGITRSVIVNALRKFESAGVIESRSLGMKGTHIKILNDKLMEETKEIYLVNWIKHNMSNSPKVQKCIKKEIENIKNKEFVKLLYKSFEDLGYNIENGENNHGKYNKEYRESKHAKSLKNENEKTYKSTTNDELEQLRKRLGGE